MSTARDEGLLDQGSTNGAVRGRGEGYEETKHCRQASVNVSVLDILSMTQGVGSVGVVKGQGFRPGGHA